MKRLYETDRLYLKVLDESYTNIVLDYCIRNKEFLREWEPERDEEFFTWEYQRKILKKDYEAFSWGNSLRLWILKKDDEKLIGCVGFSNIIRGAFQSCHLGYKLDKDEINKGYTTEAVKKGIEIMFNEYKLHRIEANIMPRNTASLRVVEKLGFYNEGLAYK